MQEFVLELLLFGWLRIGSRSVAAQSSRECLTVVHSVGAVLAGDLAHALLVEEVDVKPLKLLVRLDIYAVTLEDATIADFAR